MDPHAVKVLQRGQIVWLSVVVLLYTDLTVESLAFIERTDIPANHNTDSAVPGILSLLAIVVPETCLVSISPNDVCSVLECQIQEILIRLSDVGHCVAEIVVDVVDCNYELFQARPGNQATIFLWI